MNINGNKVSDEIKGALSSSVVNNLQITLTNVFCFLPNLMIVPYGLGVTLEGMFQALADFFIALKERKACKRIYYLPMLHGL